MSEVVDLVMLLFVFGVCLFEFFFFFFFHVKFGGGRIGKPYPEATPNVYLQQGLSRPFLFSTLLQLQFYHVLQSCLNIFLTFFIRLSPA